MGITRKVTKDITAPLSVSDEKKIEALIQKGGSVTQSNRKQADENDFHSVLLKMPKNMVSDIEDELKKLPSYYAKHRTTYILQAIEEKIQRDRKKRK
ncbi:hypothetical protein BWI93_24950 [Siphonobacter sp. BAB-5385]|uniref:hypothetical protein n=1 Tax=Siphonobacter sp. BAB-5385 TaxID=1864822 RepID=UPI000B9E75AD|nr:hypothetical protein [Siphonobacter sp. BAB-5385]OZI05516.1 hypothetical protein BWI93_24950 [Siphonobacter sp. BAB-5385]